MTLTWLSAAGCVAGGDNGDPNAQLLQAGETSGGVPGAWCRPIPACDAPAPSPARSGWKNFSSSFFAAFGQPNHRGRDLVLNPGDPQRVIAKFSYGLFDKDIKGEQIAVYLLRDCGESWELLGNAKTTKDDEHPTVEGVDDSGGRIYFEIPPEKALGIGRHRLHLVVLGDLTSTDLFIEVLPPGAPVVVSDVDGTLTTTETEEFTALLSGTLPGVHVDAPKAIQILASKGYHPMYVTARPEWLVQRTRDFLNRNGFPQGIVHTTLGLTGATGASAAAYKTEELAALADRDIVPDWAFGNTVTDAQAYDNAGIASRDQRVFYNFEDKEHGGRTIKEYTDLISELEALPSLCE